MLNTDHFYFNSIKNYIIAISHIFDDIHVIRTDASGATVKDIKVPLTYAGKTKLFYKLQRNTEIEKKIAIILPRISFIMDSMQRDSIRSTPYTNTITIKTENGNEEFQYNPIPYNFNFTVSIWSKFVDDLHQMIEQIPSFFDPDFNITVNEIPALNITKNISINLDNIDLQTDNDFSEDEDRIVTADLLLILKGYIYKPISNSKIIEHIKINMIDNNTEVKAVLENIEHRWNDLTQNIDTSISTVISTV